MAQRRLFRRININHLHHSSGTRCSLETRFYHLLTSAPHLIPYVQELCLDFHARYDNESHLHVELTSALRLLAGKDDDYSGGAPLCEITLKSLKWDKASLEMQTALIDLLSCASLQYVMLHHILAFPMSIVKHFPPELRSFNVDNVCFRLPPLSQAPSLPNNVLGKQMTHLESVMLIDSSALYTITAHGVTEPFSYKFIEMMFDTTHLRATGLAINVPDADQTHT
ncbi:hypothetical protein AX17_002953 [Amanita inopinata Kibby_2008]|nr:hypothetical protein AX17_002953 [Amanita inopinata Kibby_2008]